VPVEEFLVLPFFPIFGRVYSTLLAGRGFSEKFGIELKPILKRNGLFILGLTIED
jgi:hypothetical protein